MTIYNKRLVSKLELSYDSQLFAVYNGFIRVAVDDSVNICVTGFVGEKRCKDISPEDIKRRTYTNPIPSLVCNDSQSFTHTIVVDTYQVKHEPISTCHIAQISRRCSGFGEPYGRLPFYCGFILDGIITTMYIFCFVHSTNIKYGDTFITFEAGFLLMQRRFLRFNFQQLYLCMYRVFAQKLSPEKRNVSCVLSTT